MIDLHCHILPGIDDGPQTLDKSIEMAKAAVAEGIEYVLVTPHYQNGQFINKKVDILEAMEAFQTVLNMRGIPLKLFPGQEVRITAQLLEQIDANEIQFIDEENKYVLIEFPTMSVPNFSETLFFQLAKRGITPIIVHPERNQVFMQHPDVLYQFIEKGALGQLTAGSYLGFFGKKIQKFSTQLIEANLVHMLASDAHNITTRTFCLKKSYEKLKKEFGIEQVDEWKQTTKDLINGCVILPHTPQKIHKKFKIF